MNSNYIFTEMSYEYKCSCRNVIFWIFVFLGIMGITLYVFTPLSGLGSAESIEQLFQRPVMDWFSRSLSSSIPFKCAYLFNILQLFFVVALVINDTRPVPFGLHGGFERSCPGKFRDHYGECHR